MVIIRMTGGLGNQMFQYALYLKLKFMGKEVKFDDFTEYELPGARPIQLWVFGIDYPKASQYELDKMTDGFLWFAHRIRRKIFGRKSLEYHEKDCNFDEKVLQKDPAYLTGYFQSEKYFADIREQVGEAFSFSPVICERLDQASLSMMKDYREQIEKTLSVSLHIRRGDYLENRKVYGDICTPEYYDSAIEMMKEQFITPVFYVFSNDEEWVVEWCKEQEDKYHSCFVPVIGFPEEKGYLAMSLMSLCKHHIVANSSFSWWGAWLNKNPDKIVAAPAKWFNNQDCYDIYTKEMIKISPRGMMVKDGTE